MSEQATGERAPKGAASWWTRIRRRWWVRWSIDLLLLGLIFAGISMWQGRDLVSTGEAAPAIELMGLDGQPHEVAAQEGQKTMLVFWAPWCGVCKAESDNLSRVKSWLGERVNVVSVVLGYEGEGRLAPGERPADVVRFVEAHGVDYPVLLGDRGTSADYKISVFPTMYIIDDEGKIEHTVTGYSTTFGMLWRVLL